MLKANRLIENAGESGICAWPCDHLEWVLKRLKTTYFPCLLIYPFFIPLLSSFIYLHLLLQGSVGTKAKLQQRTSHHRSIKAY